MPPIQGAEEEVNEAPETPSEASTEVSTESPLSPEDRFFSYFDSPGNPPEAQQKEQPPAEEDKATEGQQEAQDAEAETVEDDAIELEPDQLADLLGIDHESLALDDDGNLKINIKVDGERSSVDLKSLIKGYQLEKHVNRKSEELSAKRKAFEEEANSLREGYLKQLDEAKVLSQAIESRIVKKYQGIDWQRLRVENPAEFAATYAEMQSDVAEINGVKNTLSSKLAEESERRNQEYQKAIKEQAKSEYSTLIDKLPSWSDDKVQSQEWKDITEALKGIGYSQDQIDSAILDHKSIITARYAMLYLKQQSGNKAAADSASQKKVVKVQKFVKPSAPKQEPTKKTKLKELRARLKKSGKDADFIAYLEHLE